MGALARDGREPCLRPVLRGIPALPPCFPQAIADHRVPRTYLRPLSCDPDVLAGLHTAALTVSRPLAGVTMPAMHLAALVLIHT